MKVTVIRRPSTYRSLVLVRAMLLLVFLPVLLVNCSGDQEKASAIELKPYDFTYKYYAEILSSYLEDNLINYAELKANRGLLDSAVAGLETADLSAAANGEKMAFYINAYNMITLRSVIDAYPVESIKDIDGVWDEKEWLVAGERVTLNEIEHEILLEEFSEPRIHVAVNCASIGCPPLAPWPYYPDSLDAQMEQMSRDFATSPQYNRLFPESGRAEISKIFDWYAEDFIPLYYDSGRFSGVEKDINACLHFLIEHHPQEQREQLYIPEYEVSFIDYDWSLNEAK